MVCFEDLKKINDMHKDYFYKYRISKYEGSDNLYLIQDVENRNVDKFMAGKYDDTILSSNMIVDKILGVDGNIYIENLEDFSDDDCLYTYEEDRVIRLRFEIEDVIVCRAIKDKSEGYEKRKVYIEVIRNYNGLEEPERIFVCDLNEALYCDMDEEFSATDRVLDKISEVLMSHGFMVLSENEVYYLKENIDFEVDCIKKMVL